jgi:hypothetical protein
VKRSLRKDRGIAVFRGLVPTTWIDSPTIANYQNVGDLRKFYIRLNHRGRHKNEAKPKESASIHQRVIRVLAPWAVTLTSADQALGREASRR